MRRAGRCSRGLGDVCTRTGRAWTLKEAASRLWDYVSVGWARKAIACGYSNRERFRNAILFDLGGLDLYPRPASAHTTSLSVILIAHATRCLLVKSDIMGRPLTTKSDFRTR